MRLLNDMTGTSGSQLSYGWEKARKHDCRALTRDELYIARSAKEAAWSAAEAAREPQKLSTCSQQWP
jgi:hypothetical protein